MKPEDAQRDRQALEIFSRAVEMASAEVRAGYLEGACGGDERLKARVEALLAHHVQDSFLQQPAAVPGPRATVLRPVTEKPGDRIGRYKLLEQIGEGGCGVVYVAEQEEPIRRRVALKVIKLGMDTKSVIARFEAERQALALMDHPNIAKVLDAGATETGRPFFVMELVRGIKITDCCDQNNLSTRERLDLFIQVCHAIQHAHQKGIIHRDIKPSNILVTLHDGVPVPKVIDFGIAKATTQQRLTDKTAYTAFEQFIGTPAYMSPEQAEMSGLDIDTRSDIYALGVLLYELLTGKTPFDPKTLLAMGLAEMRRVIREQEPARPSTRLGTMVAGELTTTAKHRHAEVPKLIHQVQGDLDWIVMKALEKDRTRRYETANGLALDVECHLKHEPVVARPPSTTYRVQKFVRRNKLMVTAGATVATALVVGSIVSTWQAIEARRARNAEKGQRLAAQTERDKAQAAQKEAEQSQQAEQQARLRADRLLYVANMNVAQLAWDQNNIGRLRQLLEDTQASPDRGFEWYYWQRQTHLALKTLRSHLEAVCSVAFSPDGQRIVTGSWDETAKVWEAASGRELLTLKGHNDQIWSVAFSPDGQRIATGSSDQTAKVWEAASGRELLTLKGHNDQISSVAFSPDGQRIVTGSGDQTAKVWEAASGRELLTLKGHSGGIASVAFSPDGQRIVTGSNDQTAKVWEAARAEQVAVWQQEERAAVQSLTALQRERTAEQERQRIARARDSIKQWLLLAPIPLATGQSGAEGLDIEQIEGEGGLRPKAGEARSIGGGDLKWREVALTNEVIDFNATLGQVTTQSVAYLVCYLRSEAAQGGLQMLVGSDDEAKVYLNGKEVYKCPFPRSFYAEQDRVPDIALNAGLNVLVFKVVNEPGDWQGSIRFTDAQGNPVKGIKVTLNPDAKD